MTRLPPRRKPQKSGIERGPQRVWLRHRAWLRSHHCVVSGCFTEPVEISHIRSSANAGTGIKPMDCFAVPMCHGHHMEYHQDGADTFEKRHWLNLRALALEFFKRSPDTEMRSALRLVMAEELECLSNSRPR